MENERERLTSRVQEVEHKLKKTKEKSLEDVLNQNKLQLERENLVYLKTQLEKEVWQYRNENHILLDRVDKLKEDIILLREDHIPDVNNSPRQHDVHTTAQPLQSEIDESKQQVILLKESLETLIKEKEEERLDFHELNKESRKTFFKLEHESMSKDEQMSDLLKEVELLKTKLTDKQANLVKEKEEESLDFQKLNEESRNTYSKLEHKSMSKDKKMSDLLKEVEIVKTKLAEEQETCRDLHEILCEHEGKFEETSVEKPSTKNIIFKKTPSENNDVKATYANIVKKRDFIVSNDTRDIICRPDPTRKQAT